jgi:predicted extracellular nuclease
MKQHLPIVFYNTENLFDTQDDRKSRGDDAFTPEGFLEWTPERFAKKIRHTAAALCLMKGTAPALFGVCEIENLFVLERLIADPLLATIPYKIVHHDSEDTRGIDCALIYDSSKMQLTNARFHAVTFNGKPLPTREIVEGQFLVNGKELFVFVNHWSSRREGLEVTKPRRIAAAKTLRKRIDELLNKNPLANILIMGDFNDTPTDESLHKILRAKGQHELAKNDLINLLIEEEKNDSGTHIFQGDWMVFDQLIVSQGLLQGRNGLEIHKSNAFILKHEMLLTKKGNETLLHPTFAGDDYVGGYSDHLPVYLEIKVK